jgi:hypothetical protein
LSGQQYTKLFLLLWIASAAAFDVFANWYWGRDSTISVVTRNIAIDDPIAAFALGVVAGHIFWSLR